MGCCKCLIGSLFRLILILLNLPLVLAAIAFIFFGIMIAFLFQDLVYWFTVGLNLDVQTQSVVNNFLGYIDGYALGIGIFLLIFGVIMFVVAFLGACGACCKNFCMIATYASLMGLVTIGTLVAAIIFLVDSSLILGPLQEESLRLITDHYDDQDNPARAGNITYIDPIAYIYISLFRVLPCCGVTNYKDFQGSAKWYRQYHYASYPVQNVDRAVVPVMCCKEKFQAPGSTNYMYYWPGINPALDTSCIRNPTSANSYMDTPCIPYLTQGPDAIFAWVIFGIAMSLLVLFVMAVILAVWFKKKAHGGNNFEMT